MLMAIIVWRWWRWQRRGLRARPTQITATSLITINIGCFTLAKCAKRGQYPPTKATPMITCLCYVLMYAFLCGHDRAFRATLSMVMVELILYKSIKKKRKHSPREQEPFNPNKILTWHAMSFVVRRRWRRWGQRMNHSNLKKNSFY